MTKLNLDFTYLDSLFEIDFTKRVVSLKPCADGSLQTSLNTQQLYNWYRHKQTEAMWAKNAIGGSGFIGLQPVITFLEGLKIQIPAVKSFTIHGMISTEEAGEYPFIVEPETSLVISQYARPHANVFLSHSSVDKPFVRELRQKLYSVCDTFFDETDIYPGQSITQRLNQELTATNLLVLMFSIHASNSDWVRKEWASMSYLNKPLVVVRLDETPLPPLLIDFKYIPYEGDIGLVADGIAQALCVTPLR